MMNEKIMNIKLLAMDVDGVLTNGEIIYSDTGIELKNFNIQDGLGLVLAKGAGLKTAIITGRSSTAIQKRAEELEIGDICQNVLLKSVAISALCDKYNLKQENIAYVGDDINDIPAFSRAGFKIAVNNSSTDLMEMADYITDRKGGNGAIREVVELILRSQNKWDIVLTNYFERIGFIE